MGGVAHGMSHPDKSASAFFNSASSSRILITVPQLTLHASIANLILLVLLHRSLAPILILRFVHGCFLLLNYGALNTARTLVWPLPFCTLKHCRWNLQYANG